MKPWIGVVMIAAATGSAALAGDVDQRVAESRAAVQTFMKTLKGELQSAMRVGGPVNAIEVCHTRAPEIAADVTREKGWAKVGRTSLKPRNPGNAPDAWEQTVLERFEQRKAEGEHPKQMEHHAVVETDDGHVLRYMKAIPTGQLCLNCHGKDIDPAVKAKIDELYPRDQATGFELGDIRGAFTIVQPLPPDDG